MQHKDVNHSILLGAKKEDENLAAEGDEHANKEEVKRMRVEEWEEDKSICVGEEDDESVRIEKREEGENASGEEEDESACRDVGAEEG